MHLREQRCPGEESVSSSSLCCLLPLRIPLRPAKRSNRKQNEALPVGSPAFCPKGQSRHGAYPFFCSSSFFNCFKAA
jgi:hypothetical protein